MSERIKLGIVGAGAMGEIHCRVASQLHSRFELVAVHDLDDARAAAVADQFGIAALALESLLERVDAVVVATPPAAHAAVAIRALESGRHVLVEKPIASTVGDGEAIGVAARRSGRVCLIGHIERYNPTFPELVAVLDGARPLGVSIRRLNYFAPRVTDTDVTMDLLIHDADLLLELAGEPPASVFAAGMMVETAQLDHVEAVLSFPSGIIASLTASRITEDKVRRIDVVTTGRYIVADLLRRTLTIHRRASAEWQPQGRDVRFRLDSVTQQVQLPSAEPLQLELADFAQAINMGHEPAVTPDDGIRALALVSQIQEAARRSAPSQTTTRAPVLPGA